MNSTTLNRRYYIILFLLFVIDAKQNGIQSLGEALSVLVFGIFGIILFLRDCYQTHNEKLW